MERERLEVEEMPSDRSGFSETKIAIALEQNEGKTKQIKSQNAVVPLFKAPKKEKRKKKSGILLDHTNTIIFK